MTWRHRLSAVGALVLVPIGLAALAVAIFRGLPALLVPVVLLGVAIYGTWKAIVRRGVRRRVYAAVAGVAGIGAVVGFVVVAVEWPLLVLSAGSLALGGVLAGWALVWMHEPAGRLVGPARHPVLFVNPRSGGGVAEDAGLVEGARQRGIRVVELAEGDDLAALARRAARRGADCLGMAGGDGSLAAVAQAARAAHIPFVCVPAGTRNHFALDLGLDRKDPLAALDAFGEAFQRRVDVAAVNGRTFLNNVSVGAYGEVVAQEEYRDNKVATALDAIPDLVGPDAEPLDLRFTDGDGVEQDSAVVLHVSNNSYDLSLSGGFGSRATLSDGELGIVAMRTAERGDRPEVSQWQARSFEVDSGGPVATGIDGEAVELAPPLRFTIEPDALRVRIPREAGGVSPAARRVPVTTETVRRLLAVVRGVDPTT